MGDIESKRLVKRNLRIVERLLNEALGAAKSVSDEEYAWYADRIDEMHEATTDTLDEIQFTEEEEAEEDQKGL